MGEHTVWEGRRFHAVASALCQARSAATLPVFVRQLFPASPRGRYSFTVAETGAQKVKTLAQEHIASKRQSPD